MDSINSRKSLRPCPVNRDIFPMLKHGSYVTLTLSIVKTTCGNQSCLEVRIENKCMTAFDRKKNFTRKYSTWDLLSFVDISKKCIKKIDRVDKRQEVRRSLRYQLFKSKDRKRTKARVKLLVRMLALKGTLTKSFKTGVSFSWQHSPIHV